MLMENYLKYSVKRHACSLVSVEQRYHITRKMVPMPLQGGRAHSFKKKKFLILNFIPFFALLSSSVSRANLSCVVATIFSSLAFLSTSVSMVNLSCLLATTFSRYRDAVHRYRDVVHRYRDVVHRYRDAVHS